MPDDSRTIPITFQLDFETATALADHVTRTRIERLIRQIATTTSRTRRSAVRRHRRVVGRCRPTRADGRDPRCRTGRIQRRTPGAAFRGLIVLDASTIVGAAIRRGSVPDRAMRRAFATNRVAVSDDVIAEPMDVLYRPKLARFVNPELRDDVFSLLDTDGVTFTPTERVTDCRDLRVRWEGLQNIVGRYSKMSYRDELMSGIASVWTDENRSRRSPWSKISERFDERRVAYVGAAFASC